MNSPMTMEFHLTLTDSSERPRKRRRITQEKKTVTFSSKVKTALTNNTNDLLAQSSWLTADELTSMKKRAKNLSILHYLKTRSGEPTKPSNPSGIVYNCHPAHYQIIGESLRGMEYLTDIPKGRSRERLRSDVISLVEEQQHLDKTNRSKLACMYRESSKEALLYSRKNAEEDANIAAAILAEDLKQV